jgi:hypothetical protein
LSQLSSHVSVRARASVNRIGESPLHRLYNVKMVEDVAETDEVAAGTLPGALYNVKMVEDVAETAIVRESI